ncbi:hypothetical protein [Roseovarius sp. EL26]|uniref:hypothetical protein n=1 Tax=Roseovarius sp. EL26 TaxID=2126672 RepID=UPI000EA22C42|nr:hypothetical protein [Roseovarius sp. EL26]
METLLKGTVEDSGTQDNIQIGWVAELIFDREDTGGYYLVFSNPQNEDEGFDNWFLTKQDALLNLDDWQMNIIWALSS